MQFIWSWRAFRVEIMWKDRARRELSAQCVSAAWCWQTCSHSWLYLGCFHSLNHIIRDTDRVDLAMNFAFRLTCGCENCLNLNCVFLSLFTKLFLDMLAAYGPKDSKVCLYTTLVQTETSRQLLDGLPWHLVHTFMFPSQWTVRTLVWFLNFQGQGFNLSNTLPAKLRHYCHHPQLYFVYFVLSATNVSMVTR